MTLMGNIFRVIAAGAVALFLIGGPVSARAQARGDAQSVLQNAQQAGAKMEWDSSSRMRGLVDQLRGLATVALLIAIVTASLMAGITGKSTNAIYVAGGAIVLYGGFWILLLIIQAFNAAPQNLPTGDKEITSPINVGEAVAPVIRDFVGYGINMLTTVTLPFLIIYGFWMALGVASGESQGAGPQIKNYVIGAVVALGASIIIQVFYRFS